LKGKEERGTEASALNEKGSQEWSIYNEFGRGLLKVSNKQGSTLTNCSWWGHGAVAEKVQRLKGKSPPKLQLRQPIE